MIQIFFFQKKKRNRVRQGVLILNPLCVILYGVTHQETEGVSHAQQDHQRPEMKPNAGKTSQLDLPRPRSDLQTVKNWMYMTLFMNYTVVLERFSVIV